jgi:hypothetical protein
MSADYDSRPDTHEHIAQVRGLVLGVAEDLIERAHRHDRSKLEEPERAVFDRVTPQLRATTYGSEEYRGFLGEMGEGLAHHYECCDHHPEHFPPGAAHDVDVEVSTKHHHGGDEYTVATATCWSCEWTARGDEGDVRDDAASHERERREPSGIHAMNLIQLTEMLCDWIAATRRHDDGDIHRSIDQNAERFGYGDELRDILHRTVDAVLEREVGA